MRALARVDASAQIGFGHLSRTSTLLSALRERGVSLVVATHAPTDAARAWIARTGATLFEIGAAPGSPSDLSETRALASEAELVIVDGYVFDASFHDGLRDARRAVVAIDDLGEAPTGADVVLNGNLYAEALTYATPPGGHALLGPRYALVRAEFLAARAAREARAPSTEGAPRLLVTMGGADPTGETEKALDAIAQVDEPLHARVILGGANPRASDLAARARSLGNGARRVEAIVSATDMGDQMVWADAALTAAGSTCLELATVGVAGATVTVAENQRLVARAFDARGLLRSLGVARDVTPDAMRAAIVGLLADPAERRRAEMAQRAAVDGRGAARAAEALLAIGEGRAPKT